MARRPAIAAYPRCEGSFYVETNTVYQYMAVKPGSDDHQVMALESGDSDGVACLGIAQYEALANEAVSVVWLGPSFAKADGSITCLDAVGASYSATATENGELVTLSTLANGGMILAVALEDAADDEEFWAAIVLQYQLATS